MIVSISHCHACIDISLSCMVSIPHKIAYIFIFNVNHVQVFCVNLPSDFAIYRVKNRTRYDKNTPISIVSVNHVRLKMTMSVFSSYRVLGRRKTWYPYRINLPSDFAIYRVKSLCYRVKNRTRYDKNTPISIVSVVRLKMTMSVFSSYRVLGRRKY
jgi:hypothetical protein